MVAGFIALAEAAPEELSTIANVMPAPPLPFLPATQHGQLVIMALMVYAGEIEAGQRAVAPFRALASPLVDLVKPMSYPEIDPPEDPDYHPAAVGHTMFVDSVDRQVAETIVKYLQASDASVRVAQLRVLGGAMARVPAEATAFAHRASRITVNVAASYEGPEDRAVRQAWVAEFAAALRQSQGDSGAYVGFVGDEGEARIRQAYPGSTWERLAAVKRRYDPANLFRLTHNIPPAPNDPDPGEVNRGAQTTIPHSQPRNHPHTQPWTALLFGLVVLIAAGAPVGTAEATPPPHASAHPYVGTWNYDQPDPATTRNIAVLSCPTAGNGCAWSPLPLPLAIPQIGNIVFPAAANHTVVGRTDQGCTWTFAVTTGSLELSPPAQSCFNHNIGSSYTLTRWSVTVVGNHERETIIGISHQPGGDLVTTMHHGARTRVTGVGGFPAMARFLGAWTYDPASSQTLVNMVVTVPSGGGPAGISPLQGAVGFTSEHYGAVVARTADGCQWTLAVQGNTAELDPATQTCRLATGTVMLFFWSAASDGKHENAVMAGTKDLNGQQSTFYLYIGALTKQEQPQQ